MRIIVDGFGGDNAPGEILLGCAQAVEELGYPMKPFRYDFHWKKRKKA